MDRLTPIFVTASSHGMLDPMIGNTYLFQSDSDVVSDTYLTACTPKSEKGRELSDDWRILRLTLPITGG